MIKQVSQYAIAVSVAVATFVASSRAGSFPLAARHSALASAPGNSADFDVRHELKVPIPDGAKRVRVWFVLPMEDPMQNIKGLRVTSNLPNRITTDTKTGNRYAYVEAQNPTDRTLEVVSTFHVTRQEIRREVDADRSRPLTDAERRELAAYLQPTRHVIVNDEIRKLAGEIVGDEKNPVRQARKIYDWVLNNVDYWVKQPDKLKASPVGSTEYCLSSRTGNCTDFHSLYASLAQAVGIPIRLVYGSLFKTELDGVDQDASYHCWVEFFAPELGWLPLDVAVADIYVGGFDVNDANSKLVRLTTPDGYRGPEPAKVDYYFGNLDERRVALAIGRDLTLVPPQDTDKVNAMPKAHVEIDGKAVTDFTRKLTFQQGGR